MLKSRLSHQKEPFIFICQLWLSWTSSSSSSAQAKTIVDRGGHKAVVSRMISLIVNWSDWRGRLRF